MIPITYLYIHMYIWYHTTWCIHQDPSTWNNKQAFCMKRVLNPHPSGPFGPCDLLVHVWTHSFTASVSLVCTLWGCFTIFVDIKIKHLRLIKKTTYLISDIRCQDDKKCAKIFRRPRISFQAEGSLSDVFPWNLIQASV